MFVFLFFFAFSAGFTISAHEDTGWASRKKDRALRAFPGRSRVMSVFVFFYKFSFQFIFISPFFLTKRVRGPVRRREYPQEALSDSPRSGFGALRTNIVCGNWKAISSL
uniref:Secreted protein n=1 Tax=Treubia lacunosa TaxID=93845 RepID=G4Y9T5_9MARC|nr:hypothetical protein TrlaMp36 [Treubia lacunosa]AEH99731.1 hypothetical protein TrlaMp36 [Treubia lacunosa]